MKNLKMLVVVMVIVMLSSSITMAATMNETEKFNEKLEVLRKDSLADKIETMKVLKILQGTDKGLELEKSLTRAEGSAIYARLFALERDMGDFNYENKNYTTGFNDVPNWAKGSINYLHSTGIVVGISDKEFGSQSEMTAEQFTTLILRGLGYSDKAGEFVWDKSLDKAVEIGLLSTNEKQEIEKNKQFTREEMVIISYNALFTKNPKTKETLIGIRAPFSVGDTSDRGTLTLNYLTLNAEEISEINKAEPFGEYTVFSSDKVKQNNLYNKIEKNIAKSMSLVEANIEGKPFKLWENFKIEDIWKDETYGFISINFIVNNDTPLRLYYTVEDGKLIILSDSNFMSWIATKIAKDILEDTHGKSKYIMNNMREGWTSGITSIRLSTDRVSEQEYEALSDYSVLKINVKHLK